MSNTQKAQATWKLSIADSKGAVISTHELGPGTYIIGRDPDQCGIVIKDDTAISRRHCQLVIDPTKPPVAQDLKSRNGTQVDGEFLWVNGSCELRDGSIIKLAGKTVTFSSIPTSS